MDFVKFLGGLALGATGAAFYEALRKDRPMAGAEMGQGVVTGGFGGGGPGGGFSGGGPGLIVGPPAGDGGGGFGPGVIDVVEGDGDTLSPLITGGSFFGVSSSPWFGPLNVNWLFPQPQPPNMVCLKAEMEDGEDILLCERSSQVRRPGQAFAFGPPAGWL